LADLQKVEDGLRRYPLDAIVADFATEPLQRQSPAVYGLHGFGSGSSHAFEETHLGTFQIAVGLRVGMPEQAGDRIRVTRKGQSRCR
jgi:hypothetical protein